MKLRDADWYHYLPDEVKEILSRLISAGHTTYIVGGAVRDLLMAAKPKDFDLVSTAKPEDISALFPKTLEVGRQFGISVVVLNDKPIEVAAFRKESTYSDGRHPDKIEYATPEEDALRRDFTINGLFWNPEKQQVIDYVGGIVDLENKRIRCIGDPDKRFQEDALRMLRALRFFSLLKSSGFSLDQGVIRAIQDNKNRIKKVSRERITQELDLLLKTPNPSAGFIAFAETGLWSAVFPDVALDRKAILRLDSLVEAENVNLWIALAFCVDDADKLLKDLMLPRETKEAVRFAMKLRDSADSLVSASLAEKKQKMSNPFFLTAASTIQLLFSEKAFELLLNERKNYIDAGSLNPDPLITGDDLQAIGFKPGKALGAALNEIRVAQLNEEVTGKDEALKRAKQLLTRN